MSRVAHDFHDRRASRQHWRPRDWSALPTILFVLGFLFFLALWVRVGGA